LSTSGDARLTCRPAHELDGIADANAPGAEHVGIDGKPIVEAVDDILQHPRIDLAGRTQPERAVWNRLGYGNNAIQVVPIRVS
jgi:hypothetical protein